MKIAFGHNVYNREKTLKKTIDIENKYFPNSYYFIGYNGNININSFKQNNVFFSEFSPESHKVGCVNGFLTSIKISKIKDDFDVFIFSHDDIYVNNIKIFKENIDLIINNNYDVVIRKPININEDKYFMMETVFLSPKIVKLISKEKILNNDFEISVDSRNSPSPEVYLYEILTKYSNNIKIIEYEHIHENYNKVLETTLGVFHEKAGIRGWID